MRSGLEMRERPESGWYRLIFMADQYTPGARGFLISPLQLDRDGRSANANWSRLATALDDVDLDSEQSMLVPLYTRSSSDVDTPKRILKVWGI